MSKTEKAREKVTVIKDGLTHRGQPCKAGAVIEVSAPQRAFLARKGFINDPAKSGKKEG